jgi:hypothetical protein
MRVDNTWSGAAFELIAFVTRHLVCHACGTGYDLDDVQVTHHHREQWMLRATCPACTAQRTIEAYDGPPYERLNSLDAIPPLPPLSAEDVREWRVFLRQFTGDLKALLATP